MDEREMPVCCQGRHDTGTCTKSHQEIATKSRVALRVAYMNERGRITQQDTPAPSVLHSWRSKGNICLECRLMEGSLREDTRN
ncbi:hypothetical protein E2C01_008020 [Portunus trituberculatus]|uniref:Uncharacterized protein n=1 Tax=Portunus trituberculatus TaxID=210409 RepID=A0A5B7D1N9_PORTR|nr:hypothetical protein [Portunus trituberculatus]